MQKTDVIWLELKRISKLVSRPPRGLWQRWAVQGALVLLWWLFAGWWDPGPAVLHPEPNSRVRGEAPRWPGESAASRGLLFPYINVITIEKLLCLLAFRKWRV